MKRIFVPTQSGSDWQRLLAKPDLHWKKGRSAMSTAACWEDANGQLPAEIRENLNGSDDPHLTGLNLLAAIPEWAVDLPGGTNPSCTDVMAFTSNAKGLVVVGIEAKVDEVFGPTLEEKRMNASPGQLERLDFLQEQLGCEAALPGRIRYQLLHRTVSALLTAKSFHAQVAVMMVQSFSPMSAWREDFNQFAESISSRKIHSNLYQIDSRSGPQLFIGWCQGSQKYLTVELASNM